MMRISILLGAPVFGLLLPAIAVAAPPARNTPENIICAMSDSCGGASPDASRQIQVGGEKAFSLARPSSTEVKAAAKAPPAARSAGASQRMAMASHGKRSLDMLVTFDTGSATMTDRAKAEAQAFAKAMMSPQLSAMHFNIEGHTDAVGNREYNQDLSRRRAQSVIDYLVAQGIDAQRLEARGYGFDRPKSGLSPKSAGNRRVEFVKQG